MIENDLREQICQIGELMHRFQYVDGAAGNISARLDEQRILTTPSGLAKGFMRPDQLLVVDLAGNPLSAANDLKPTSEILMHLEVYKKRPDVGGVVHAHPPHAVALTIAGIPLNYYTIPEAVVFLGDIPTTPYATPSSFENRDAIANLIGRHQALMLAYHGSLTVGKTIWEAYLRLSCLEHTARITFLTQQLGGGNPLPPEQLQKLVAQRSMWGFEIPETNQP
ncbi:MAG: class II aldolase/adducin family protein [Anaerolineae bacterium]|nr:class II aldolase/adducin family protein [Anaerolineae bacterium]